MPTYSFVCNKCQNIFELFYTFSAYDKAEFHQCDKCGSKDTERNYTEDALSINTSVIKADSELKTLGDLANRNRDKFSDDQKLDLHNKHNSYKEEAPAQELPSGMTRMKKPPKPKWR